MLSTAEEKGLCFEAKTLLRTLVSFETKCLDMALLLSSTILGEIRRTGRKKLRVACGKVLAGLVLVEEELRQIAQGADNGTSN